jgi:GNAT superfamily N-acetyltransferase
MSDKKTSIRQIHDQELLDVTYRLDNYAYTANPPFPDKTEWDERMKTRKGPSYYALFEGDEAVAVVGCPTLTQNVRGKIFKMGGFASIATHPKARRKGYVRELMRHAYEQQINEGRVVSSLYPFRGSFYERLGYVTFPQTRQAIFDPQDLNPILKMDLPGEAKLVLIGEAYDEYRDYVLAMQPGVHGLANFEDSQKEGVQTNRSWVLLAKIDGQVAGLMVYSLTDGEIMRFTLRATRFYYRTSAAKYLLLDWIARHVDQANRVEMWLPAYERPGTWLADIRPKLEPVFVAPMGRVLDAKGLNGMLCGPGSFTAQIVDSDCPWNNGTWKFSGDSGTLEITPAQSADCTLTIQGLSALIYGTNDPGDFPYLGWGDPPPELQTTMRTMFPLKLPYLHEYY